MFTIPHDVSALIFDVDGTLADSMPVHFVAWQEAMRTLGGAMTENDFYDMAGMATTKMIALLNERHRTTMPVEEGAKLKESLYFDLIPKVPPIKPVIDVVLANVGKRPMATASGGRRYVVTQTLTAIGLSHVFDVQVSADDVVKGKPDPEMFLEAARLMRVPPERCLVFEDGDPGIVAAESAKMRYIDVRKFGVTSSK